MLQKLKLVHWLLFVTVLSVPTMMWGFADSVSIWKARNYPIVEGKILSREPLEKFSLRKFNAPTDQITIQITDTETRVQSIMFRSASEKLPELVRFHFNGNTNDKVFIEGQTNPLKSNLFAFFTLFLIWMLYLNRKLLWYLHILITISKRGSYP